MPTLVELSTPAVGLARDCHPGSCNACCVGWGWPVSGPLWASVSAPVCAKRDWISPPLTDCHPGLAASWLSRTRTDRRQLSRAEPPGEGLESCP